MIMNKLVKILGFILQIFPMLIDLLKSLSKSKSKDVPSDDDVDFPEPK